MVYSSLAGYSPPASWQQQQQQQQKQQRSRRYQQQSSSSPPLRDEHSTSAPNVPHVVNLEVGCLLTVSLLVVCMFLTIPLLCSATTGNTGSSSTGLRCFLAYYQGFTLCVCHRTKQQQQQHHVHSLQYGKQWVVASCVFRDLVFYVEELGLQLLSAFNQT